MTVRIEQARLIVAMLPDVGGAAARIREAFDSAGLLDFVVHRARGALPGCPVDRRGVPIWREMVVIEALVPESRATDAFELAYRLNIADQPDGGMLLMGRPVRMLMPVETTATPPVETTATPNPPSSPS